ncbi:hypothetical protein CKO28_18620 [Rhodovibrio sodomensis]|uniref:HNH domain-containing protein n=1 Tax=Rhodovibrio sodomensis TaxID=1088 RepID=A0ABS1DIX9_9PROT|nr:HNH endonuclease signature motif containing protein [Rhodovibrio sodomensis]MBK1670052.1 hypothetical protein [Rhodovibrio sodomensis]
MDEAHFLESALSSGASTWSSASLGELARLQVPEGLLGRQKSLLRADINEQWARWFVESLADPRHYARLDASYPQIFADVFEVVETRFHYFSRPQKKELAASAAHILKRFVDRLQASRRRQPVPFSDKRLLLDFAGDPPRCWICGAKFAPEAVENFLYQERHEVPLPQFIDILKPRGLSHRDVAIEIDHVVAHSHGGGEENNLALSCGWCNRHKSALSSIYDVEGRPRTAGQNQLGVDSLPQPFWTVRVLAVVRRCEHPEGCEQSADKANVTVVPINQKGATNPANLRVCCYDHDPYRSIRLQPVRIVRDVWRA